MAGKDYDEDPVDRAEGDLVEADWATLVLVALPIVLIVAILVLVLAIDSSLRPW